MVAGAVTLAVDETLADDEMLVDDDDAAAAGVVAEALLGAALVDGDGVAPGSITTAELGPSW